MKKFRVKLYYGNCEVEDPMCKCLHETVIEAENNEDLKEKVEDYKWDNMDCDYQYCEVQEIV